MNLDDSSSTESNIVIIFIVFVSNVKRELRLSLLKMIMLELALHRLSPAGRFSPLLKRSRALIHTVSKRKYRLLYQRFHRH